MEADSIVRQLRDFFLESSREEWKKIATQETRGKDPFETLSHRSNDGILYLPYYDAENSSALNYLKRFELPAADNSNPRLWLNVPSIKPIDPGLANAIALEHLMHGADGVLYDLRQGATADVNTLIDNIEWPSCYIAFFPGPQPLLQSLTDLIEKKFSPALLNGALFWESIPKRSHVDFFVTNCTVFHSLGLLIQTSSPAVEVSDALAKGVKVLEDLSEFFSTSAILRAIAFSLPADSAIPESIAKFKALRMLWFQVAQAYGERSYQPEDLHIHVRSEFQPDIDLGPHQNILKGTFAAMAAISGGCNALTIESAETPNYIRRTARNIATILREESFFDRVADPFAGSWTIEAMTDEIAKKAWNLFQQNVT